MATVIFWAVLIGAAIILAGFVRYALPWLHVAKDEDHEAKLSTKIRSLTVRQWRQLGFVFVLGAMGVFAHTLRSNELFDSAALYVGLPFLLALGMCLLPKAKSRVGATFKGITIAILLAFPVLQEGVICMLMAAPLLYIIGLLTAWSHDRYEKKEKGSTLQIVAVSSVLAIASIEGVHEQLSFERHNIAEYSKVISANIDDVRSHLSQTPTFDQPRPLFTRIFPLPANIEGQGLDVGDERKLHFRYKKWVFTNEHIGDTVFRVSASEPDQISFEIPHDDSYLSHYLNWKSSDVKLEKIDDNNTKVTWALSYERKLDPVWYFGPMQHYAVQLTAKTLVDNVADPNL